MIPIPTLVALVTSVVTLSWALEKRWWYRWSCWHLADLGADSGRRLTAELADGSRLTRNLSRDLARSCEEELQWLPPSGEAQLLVASDYYP